MVSQMAGGSIVRQVFDAKGLKKLKKAARTKLGNFITRAA